ncbi:hypothetical protein MUK42_20620 [Musa troglodytarum]|uniref:Uncharacterized protein n=1 Tax=Musa troglodytarum TaxID=320322 RepID=A0A9E7G389_9LILI|nr:hypothetical protein MUK42_20620 [Musa troglodytarum]URE05127.1 hypothetical protein MUK42_20620 [Musa troglodytarum]URE05133.1 hypothetical protein MUK42_20620 [Musa troglodytarum]
MAMVFNLISRWIWGGKGQETPNSSPSFTYDSYMGIREPDSLKSAANKGPRIRSNSRRTVKKRHNREERQIDKEYDAVLVPSDGGCMSGTESDDSDWSIGWSEHLDPEFHSEKEVNDSFAVLVPCYGRRRLEQVVSSKKHVLGSVDLRDDGHYDGKRDIEQWLAEQLST